MSSTKYMIEIMTAYTDGEVIEYRPKAPNGHVEWCSHSAPLWDWDHFDYRVQPKHVYKVGDIVYYKVEKLYAKVSRVEGEGNYRYNLSYFDNRIFSAYEDIEPLDHSKLSHEQLVVLKLPSGYRIDNWGAFKDKLVSSDTVPYVGQGLL